jgi:hypothetical protein
VYRLCIASLNQNSGKGDLGILGTKHKDDFEPYGKMRGTGSAPSTSCPQIIQRLGCLLPTSSGTLAATGYWPDSRS